MAESGADPKVEDVLSSVRRLVSNETPRNARPALSEGPGALVLEDSQRIEAESSARQSAKSLEDRIAELEAAVDARLDEWEPDGSEDQEQHRPDRIVYTRPPTKDESDQMRHQTLRLSQLELVHTEREEEQVEELPTAAPPFRHAPEEAAQTDAEAPMAENVPTVPKPKAEVKAFSDPDDVLEHIEARINSGGLPVEPVVVDTPDQRPEHVEQRRDVAEPAPEVEPNSQADQLEPMAPPIEDDTTKPADDEFEEALSAAVSGSLSSPSDEGADESANTSEPLVLGVPANMAGELDMPIVLPVAEEAPADDEDMSAAQAEEAASEEPGSEASESPSAEAVSEPEQTSRDTDVVQPHASAPSVDDAETADGSQETSREDAPSAGEELERAVAMEAIGQAVGEHFDHGALQPVVADMIRKELQGELGERITRNVRKLVRREIKRALQAQELD